MQFTIRSVTHIASAAAFAEDGRGLHVLLLRRSHQRQLSLPTARRREGATRLEEAAEAAARALAQEADITVPADAFRRLGYVGIEHLPPSVDCGTDVWVTLLRERLPATAGPGVVSAEWVPAEHGHDALSPGQAAILKQALEFVSREWPR